MFYIACIAKSVKAISGLHVLNVTKIQISIKYRTKRCQGGEGGEMAREHYCNKKTVITN